MEVSVLEAAEALGISARRVRALIDSGQIAARRSGRRVWLVDLDAARSARRRPRSAGQPISSRSAWAILDLAEGRRPHGLSASEIGRAKQRVRRLADLRPGALASRARVHRLRAHPGVLKRLGEDPALVLGGSSAAGRHGADLIAVDRVEAYIRPEDLAAFVSRYALRQAPDGRENVLIRVPSEWQFPSGVRDAPVAVVAVDLIDAGDERSVRAGRKLLGRILEEGEAL